MALVVLLALLVTGSLRLVWAGPILFGDGQPMVAFLLWPPAPPPPPPPRVARMRKPAKNVRPPTCPVPPPEGSR